MTRAADRFGDFVIRIIGDQIFFRGFLVGEIKDDLPATLRADFEETVSLAGYVESLKRRLDADGRPYPELPRN